MQQLLTLHHPQTRGEYCLQGNWRNEAMDGPLAEHASTQGRKFALQDAQHRLTWQQLHEWVDSVAAYLHNLGLSGGDRVAVWLPNRVEAVVVFLACSRNGYVCNPSLHQNYTVAEISALLERISCRVLFAQPGYGADATEANIFEKARALPTVKRVVALPAEPGVSVTPDGADAFPASRSTAAVPPSDSNPDKVVYLAFTSGTTGTPKGVMHSDNTLLANGRAMVADWGHDAATVLLTLSPISHHIGTVALEQTLVAGCELVVRDPSSKMTLLEWIEETNATYVMGVPTHAMDVLAEAHKAGRKRLGKVKVFYMAARPPTHQSARKLIGSRV